MDVNGYYKTGPENFSPYNKRIFDTDGRGNIYYLNSGIIWEFREDGAGEVSDGYRGRVTKITALGNRKASGKDITPSTYDVKSAVVDNSGNIIFSYYYYDYGLQNGFYPKMIMSASGNIKNLSSITGVEDYQINAIWKSADGNFYYSNSGIKRINPSTLEAEDYGALDLNDLQNGIGCKYYKFDFNDRTYLVYPGGVAEVYNSTATLKKSVFAGLSVDKIYHACSTENYIYVSGEDTSSNYFLIKVDPDTGNNTKLLWNNYKVLSFTASETDGVVFNGLRILDGKKYFGKVPANGGEVVPLPGVKNAEIFYLERIR